MPDIIPSIHKYYLVRLLKIAPCCQTKFDFIVGNTRGKFLKRILSSVAFVVFVINAPGRVINLQLVLGYTRVGGDVKQGDENAEPREG